MLSEYEQKRLAQIRADLEKHTVLGFETWSWNDHFLLGILERVMQKKVKAGK